MGFADHFSQIAPDYATYRPHYPRALFDVIASACTSRQRAWDAACGNGQATLDIAERFDDVVGTDASADQITQAPPHPRITWRVARAEASSLPSSSCDLVTCAQALHWLDIDAFFREVQQVLVPGGVVAVWCYGDVRSTDARIDDIVRRYSHETVGPYWPPQRRLLDDGYRHIPFPFAEIPAPPLTMNAQWTLAHLLGYIRTWSATNRFMERTRADPVVPLTHELEAVWGDRAMPRELWWKLSLRMGRRNDAR